MARPPTAVSKQNAALLNPDAQVVVEEGLPEPADPAARVLQVDERRQVETIPKSRFRALRVRHLRVPVEVTVAIRLPVASAASMRPSAESTASPPEPATERATTSHAHDPCRAADAARSTPLTARSANLTAATEFGKIFRNHCGFKRFRSHRIVSTTAEGAALCR